MYTSTTVSPFLNPLRRSRLGIHKHNNLSLPSILLINSNFNNILNFVSPFSYHHDVHYYSSTSIALLSSSNDRNPKITNISSTRTINHTSPILSSLSSSSTRRTNQLITNLRTQNKEALRLYRDILRVCKQFNFPDDQGRHWGEVLAKSARQEFENSRNLNPNSEEVTRLLIIGTDALMQIQQKFSIAEERLINAVTNNITNSPSETIPKSTDVHNSGMIMQQINTNTSSSSKLPPPSSSSSSSSSSSNSNRNTKNLPPKTIIEVDESIYTTHERAEPNKSDSFPIFKK